MQIIKDRELIENSWIFISDESALPMKPLDITVSLNRWNTCQAELKKYSGKVGLRVNPDDDLNNLSLSTEQPPLIEINFPVYTDGRGFSHTQRLRTQFKYTGEIRAVGQFMPDQFFYLARVGVNAFALEDKKLLQAGLTTLNDFSKSYQSSVN